MRCFLRCVAALSHHCCLVKGEAVSRHFFDDYDADDDEEDQYLYTYCWYNSVTIMKIILAINITSHHQHLEYHACLHDFQSSGMGLLVKLATRTSTRPDVWFINQSITSVLRFNKNGTWNIGKSQDLQKIKANHQVQLWKNTWCVVLLWMKWWTWCLWMGGWIRWWFGLNTFLLGSAELSFTNGGQKQEGLLSRAEVTPRYKCIYTYIQNTYHIHIYNIQIVGIKTVKPWSLSSEDCTQPFTYGLCASKGRPELRIELRQL